MAQHSQRKRSIQWVCMCLVTMTAFLGAGIRPVIGNRRGSGATPKSTLLTLKGFPLQEPTTPPRLSSPLLCQKQCLFVVWRISTQRRCDKNVSILALTRVYYSFMLETIAQEVTVRVKHLFLHQWQIPGLQRVFVAIAGNDKYCAWYSNIFWFNIFNWFKRISGISCNLKNRW